MDATIRVLDVGGGGLTGRKTVASLVPGVYTAEAEGTDGALVTGTASLSAGETFELVLELE